VCVVYQILGIREATNDFVSFLQCCNGTTLPSVDDIIHKAAASSS
jgi:hypothetical protein